MVLDIVTQDGFDFGIGTNGDDVVIMAQLPADQLNQLRSSPFTDAIALLGGNDYFENDDTGRIVFGNAGNDTLIGGAGNDTIAGGRDDDYIDGRGGNNIIFGNIGNDTVIGGSGNDTIFGGQGNDVLIGGPGNDVLSGDRGFDTLTGGGGANQFFLQASSANRDVITDFQPGVDKLRLPDGVSNLQLRPSGNNAEIIRNGEAIATLNDIDPSSLTRNDFIGQIGEISNLSPDGPNPNFEQQVLELVNRERAKEGLQPLVWEPLLAQAARTHSTNMALQDFYSHTGADGSRFTDRIRATGFSITGASAENIYASPTTPEAVVAGWMNSPPHRDSILNPEFTQLGVGHYFLENDTGNENWNHYWTQKFHAGQPSIQEPDEFRARPPVEDLPPLPPPPDQPGTPPLPNPPTPEEGKIPDGIPTDDQGDPLEPDSQDPSRSDPIGGPGSPPNDPDPIEPDFQDPSRPEPVADPAPPPPEPTLVGSVNPVAPVPGAAPPGMTFPVP